jgi:hypothetical protein
MKAPQQCLCTLILLSVATLSSLSQNLNAQDDIEYSLDNLDHLSPGIYFIRIRNKNEVFTQKIMKR